MPASGIFHHYLSGLRYHMISDPFLPQRRFEDHVRSLLHGASFSLRPGRHPVLPPDPTRKSETPYKPHIRAIWKPGPVSFGIECLLFRQWPRKGPQALLRTLVHERRSTWSKDNDSLLYFILGSQVPDRPGLSPDVPISNHYLLLFSLDEVLDAVQHRSCIQPRRHPWGLPFTWNGNGLC